MSALKRREAELQGRVANLLWQAERKSEAAPYAEASVAYFRKIGDSPGATPQQLIEAVRSVAETGVPSLRDYPAAAAWFAGAAAFVLIVMPEANPVVRLSAFALLNGTAAVGLMMLALRRGRPETPMRLTATGPNITT